MSTFIFFLILIAAILVVLFFVFYRRASKEIAFVRTGLGGEKIVKAGGAIVIPRLHEVIEVYMNTLRLEVKSVNEASVITKDRMRVDVIVDFYVHVSPELAGISMAASTLASRTKNAEALKDIVEGKFVDAIRSTVAETTMEELHEQRKAFIGKMRESVAEDLRRNGLELEGASLIQLDQTDMNYFNPSNAFDAEGLTTLTEKIESRKKTRNDIEQDTKILVRKKNLETEKHNLELEREEQYARLNQELDVESRKSEQMAGIARRRAEQSQEGEEAEIVSRQKVEIAKINSERSIEEERLDRERSINERKIEMEKIIKLAEQAREVEISLFSKKTSEAKAEAEATRADLVVAEEKVVTAREEEAAARRKAIELIEASREAEGKALTMKIMADSEKVAAVDRAEAIKIEAEGQKIRDKVEADGTRALYEARNILVPEQIEADLRKYIVDNMPQIIRESAKPMEQIDSIKVVQADGLWGSTGTGSGTDGVFDSALRFKAKAPIIDSLLRDLGLEVTSLEGSLGNSGVTAKKGEGDKGKTS